MKNLILVRHAKSSWNNATISDFERPLNERGNRDKTIMGERLKERDDTIQKIVSSSAKRTTQTSIALAKAIDYSTADIQYEDAIYHSSVTTMMQFINEMDNSVDTLMLVAHNPGISMLCDYLCGNLFDFPTLGITKISFDTKDWQEVFRDTGSLEWVDYPKKAH